MVYEERDRDMPTSGRETTPVAPDVQAYVVRAAATTAGDAVRHLLGVIEAHPNGVGCLTDADKAVLEAAAEVAERIAQANKQIEN